MHTKLHQSLPIPKDNKANRVRHLKKNLQLVFVLNLGDKVDVLMNILHQDGVSPMDLPKVITAETYSIADL